jgi:hypothetical protein
MGSPPSKPFDEECWNKKYNTPKIPKPSIEEQLLESILCSFRFRTK